MDQSQHDSIYHHHSMQMQSPNPPFTDFNQHQPLLDSFNTSTTRSHPRPNQRPESEVKDSVAARKIQKVDREKLRRDRLNEHFFELGNALDPDRPKNDKATILANTIQLLKDLTSQVNKLKAEYAALTEESRELTQEKNDLREEKATLKSDIENLNIQYQQRLRSAYPWITVDPSVVMAPTSYPFPMPVPIPPGPIPMHPTMQPYSFFGSQTAVIHNPCSIVPYMTHSALVDQQATQLASSLEQPASLSHVSGKQDSKDKSSEESKNGKSLDSNNITTELELKTPGSTSDQDLSSGQINSRRTLGKENSVTDGSSLSRCSSSRSVQDSTSTSMARSTNGDDLGSERTDK